MTFTVLPHWETRPTALGPDISRKSHYPDTEPTSRCCILINLTLSAWLGSNKYTFLSPWLESNGNRTPDLPHTRPVLYRFGHRAWPPMTRDFNVNGVGQIQVNRLMALRRNSGLGNGIPTSVYTVTPCLKCLFVVVLCPSNI